MILDEFTQENPLRVCSLFSGIGAFEKALSNINIPFKIVNYCEIDPYPAKAYSILHNISEELNLIDVASVNTNTLEDFDLLTGGSPCTDFSMIGKKQGAIWTCNNCGITYNPLQAHFTKRDKCINCGSLELKKTRSSLIIEMLRVANSKKPKYIVYENVKNIVNSSFKPTFDLFINELEEYGYKVYWKVLNSKDYNSAQSRERVFVVAIRKDIDNGFKFPIGRDSSIKIKDILEDKVDEKYYLKEERCKSLLSTMKDKLKESKNGIIQVNKPLFSQQRVYMVEGKAPTICAGNNGGGQEPCKIIVPNNRIVLLEDIKKTSNEYRIRRITPLECFRLTGFNTKDYLKLKDKFSDTRLYKMCGNSIVVSVLEEIYSSLFNLQL